jgi:hypothetical protein
MANLEWEDFVQIKPELLEFKFQNLKIKDTNRDVVKYKTVTIYGDQRSYRDLIGNFHIYINRNFCSLL